MFYMDIRHNLKKANSSKNTFHYLTRTGHFLAKKQDEELEFVRSGNMPEWAQKRPAEFWRSADKYEIERGRTSTVLTVALPKELTRQQRIELVESFIQEFTGDYQFPYTAAVHHHASALTGEDQPHLHLMYSERSQNDEIVRPAEQFFKQYRPKNPQQGGAQKMTANALGQGKNQVLIFRQTTEKLINQCLKKYAPEKTVMLHGLEFNIENQVSCLSNHDYNKKFETQLKDVPQIPRWKLHSADPIIQLEVQAQKETIQKIREQNKAERYKADYEKELIKRELAKITQLQQRYADSKEYKGYELNELYENIMKACQSLVRQDDLIAKYKEACSITNRLFERRAFGQTLLALQKDNLMHSFDCEQLIQKGASFVQINLKDADPQLWEKFDTFCEGEEDRGFLQYNFRYLVQFIQLLSQADDWRSQVIDKNFSYQLERWQRNAIQQGFEKKQAEIREFMQLYENFILPVASRYFPGDYAVDAQHHLKKFKERDHLITTALAAQVEPMIITAREQKQEKRNDPARNYEGPSF